MQEQSEQQEIESYKQRMLEKQMSAAQVNLEDELDASSERIKDLSAKLVDAKDQLQKMVQLIMRLQVTTHKTIFHLVS